MNGRIYDPVLGLFFTPDPVLQFPNLPIGLNPYTYCLNSPLSFVDPTGYSIDGAFFTFIRIMAMTVVSIGSGGALLPAMIVAGTFAVMDGMYAMAKGANVNIFVDFVAPVYINLLVTSGIGKGFGANNKVFANELLRASAHGINNGVSRMISGGKFQHGFLSGFVSSLGGSYIDKFRGDMTGAQRIAISAAIGGTAEAMGGGKFANGAVTGAYVMALNHMGGKWSEPGNPTIFINRLCIPAGFNTEEYINLLKEELVKNGFSKDLVVELYSFKGALKAWFNNSPTGTVTIKNFRLGQDRINAGGYATLYDEDSIIVYNGLSMTPSNSVVPTWEYVNATMHEIGHAFFGFYHDKFGFTNDPSSVMDVRGAYTKGAGFNSGQQNIIKKSIWGY